MWAARLAAANSRDRTLRSYSEVHAGMQQSSKLFKMCTADVAAEEAAVWAAHLAAAKSHDRTRRSYSEVHVGTQDQQTVQY